MSLLQMSVLRLFLLRNLRKPLNLMIIVILGAGLVFAVKKLKPVEAPSYQTVKVIQKDLENIIAATGKLTEIKRVDVGARVSGELKALYVKINDTVKKGQLLAILDPENQQNKIKRVQADLEVARANLLSAQSKEKIAALTLKRQRTLAEKNLVAPSDLEEKSAALLQAQATVASHKATITKARADLDVAETELGYSTIYAPIDGMVAEILQLPGQIVNAASTTPLLLKLVDVSKMFVNVEVSEADVIHLKPNVMATFNLIGDQKNNFAGLLKEIEPLPKEVDKANFYTARFEVPNAEGSLRIGMTTYANIKLAEVKQALVLPLSAIGALVATDKHKIALLVNGAKVEREVTLGLRNNLDVQILSGVNIDDEIIINEKSPSKR